ncbi:hypothetical protein FRC07_014291 [Ceratobasidium sp. 392]|nr:hypothetical protein FRC07_014291 [Ceratobasidium sp. 392]
MLVPWSTSLPRYYKQQMYTIPRLPYEDYLAIVRIYIDSLIKSLDVRDCRIKQELNELNTNLVDLTLVSRAFGELVCKEWNRYWPLSTPLIPGPWKLAQPTVYHKALTLPINLSSFQHLRFASLPADRAVEFREGAWRLMPLVAHLPSSIEELEFYWSHASEAVILALVKRICPRISKLRVVYCTMFNHPECHWWYNHQANVDHHYIKGEDLVAATTYAESVSVSLRDLPRIKKVHLGVYFIPFRAITTHRAHPAHIYYHPVQDSRVYIDGVRFHSVAHFNADWIIRHHIPPPNTGIDRLASLALWKKECPRCVQEWNKCSERAERRAASVLAARVPTLCSVSFASFVVDRRTAPTEWEVSRKIEPISTEQGQADPNVPHLGGYPGDARLYVYTKRPGEPSSRQVAQVFRRFGAEWAIQE